MITTNVQKILNLKYAGSFLDKNVVASKSDFYMLNHITRFVNEGFCLLTNIDKLCENKVFRNSFNQFFNITSDIKDFYNFISENWEWINSEINNIFTKDFKKMKYYLNSY
ncbi:hypothetical protein FRW55_02850 [Mycoplasma anserisalpingitidis]|uniref:Uncharacterized protein n=1 Tax=Mycoplasma anserisalpingitidis TaxID=519450 RepID=A0A5B8JXI6_9MOLU|nr:hypothetical protein [Mycoplasma anserisalpingitidis]QDY87081.1 hypothetical protein FRW55_02850 [Mycoplasma anserisalpingitidis]